MGHSVALRKESVDRNLTTGTLNAEIIVALRKESVDRNDYSKPRYPWTPLSLSARRAWIEMIVGSQHMQSCRVALRKESVDRNVMWTSLLVTLRPSLSARRAWIEMLCRSS